MKQSTTTATADLGLLALRLMVGLAMAAHGAQKLFGWFGGYGLEGTGAFFEQLGFAPGVLFAGLAGTGELVGGLLIAAGALGVVGPAIVVSVMLVAIGTVHLPNGFFAGSNGMEVPFLYVAASIGLALTGYGRHAVDARVSVPMLRRPVVVAGAMGMSVVGAVASLAIR